MTISGKATRAGTQAYAARYPSLPYVTLNEWSVSPAGFGSYRVSDENEAHGEALHYALQQGINLVDTSSNYADGGSESLLGAAIGSLVAAGQLAREELVIVSKVGYLQGQNLTLSAARKAAGHPFPELVEYGEQLEHCIHPEFISDQLTRSLERLNLETIDVYLLHNPEYYLGWAHRQEQPAAAAEAEYYRRLAAAMAYLEEEVRDGRIQYYGISSNTFPVSIRDPQFTSLTRVLALAEAWAAANQETHHFRVIQFPMNLFETGAATIPNQPNSQTLLDVARDNHLGVLINRPLNAIQENALTRLADVPAPSYPASKFEVSTAVDISAHAERHLQTHILPALPLDEETREQIWQYMAVGTMLEGQWRGFGTYTNWRDIRSRFILPRAQSGAQFLANLENPPVEVDSWLQGYIATLNTALAAVTAYYQESGHRLAQQIMKKATTAEASWQAATLSQTAVRALRSTAGITTVLIGMRQKAYVDDVVADLPQPVEQQVRRDAWEQMARRAPAVDK